jgi:hypothetical protein
MDDEDAEDGEDVVTPLYMELAGGDKFYILAWAGDRVMARFGPLGGDKNKPNAKSLLGQVKVCEARAGSISIQFLADRRRRGAR